MLIFCPRLLFLCVSSGENELPSLQTVWREEAGGRQEPRVSVVLHGETAAIDQQICQPTPTPSFQYRKLCSWEMIIKNLDKTTAKHSLENHFLENLISTGIVFELKDYVKHFSAQDWLSLATHSTNRLTDSQHTCRANNSDRDSCCFESPNKLPFKWTHCQVFK